MQKKTRGHIGWIPALLLGLALVLTSCEDQPIDSGDDGTVRIDTTVVTRIDTVVLNSTDTLIVRMVDTLFVDRTDTIEVEVVKRDTIRDTITRVRVDTIKVPEFSVKTKKARLQVFGRDLSGGPTQVVEQFTADLSDWLSYRIIDSAGALRGVGVTLSTGLPVRFRAIDVSRGLAANSFSLQGIALFVPLIRTGSNNILNDTVPLIHHPFALPTNGGRTGGMLLTVREFEENELSNLVTGGQLKIDGQTGGDRFLNRGVMRFTEVDRRERMIYLKIESVFYLENEIAGRASPVEFGVQIDLELEW